VVVDDAATARFEAGDAWHPVGGQLEVEAVDELLSFRS
jgi:hypothetical protein